MNLVEANLISRLGNTFTEYETKWPVRSVLNRFAREGFSVVAMSGIGQTIWTLGREIHVENPAPPPPLSNSTNV
ncbi:GTP cyclohydrolase 1 feedback regulatory protein [Aphelenchoides fujianensis]|nr:GTP cyclohydrolase 1 feedback regulatory protein [Aphelenchoides fujianensis]